MGQSSQGRLEGDCETGGQQASDGLSPLQVNIGPLHLTPEAHPWFTGKKASWVPYLPLHVSHSQHTSTALASKMH
jgi:hypothetical protein